MKRYEYDGDSVKGWAGSSQWRAWRADFARYKACGYSGWGSEGLWALTLYRLQRATRNSRPRWVWLVPRVVLKLTKKLFTVVTQINLEEGADIGPGLLIPHVGTIRIHEEATIGADCAIHHVVTIGAGSRPGGAVIGDHVMIGCHATILGPVRIGDCVTVASNSLVIHDVSANSTAIGVPARVIPKASPTAEIPAADMTRRHSSSPAVVSTPSAVPAPIRSVFDAIIAHAHSQPDRPALTCFDVSGGYRGWSWAELCEKARSARDGIAAIVPDDRPVILFSRRTPESVALVLGAIAARRPFACLNPRWRWPQVRRVLAATSSTFLFMDRDGSDAIGLSTMEDESQEISIIDIAEFVAKIHAPSPECPGDLDARRVGCYLFTSGSTGESKGVCISEQDLAWRAETEVAWYGLTRDDVLLNLLPMSFDVGLNQVLAAIYAGAETILSESWLPSDLIRMAAERRVTGIPCVPSIWQDMINHSLRFDTSDAHRSLRFITISGGDLPRAYLHRIRAIVPGVSVFKTYGQTEAFRASSLKPEDFDSRTTSVGQPFPGVTVAIVRPDGSIARRGETGELVHGGLGLMIGYLGSDELTAAKLRASPVNPAERASFSGDDAYIDADGFVHLVGRSDQMIKINGNRVYPAEVRTLLCEIPGVKDAIVLAEKDATGTMAIVAFVMSDAGINEDSFRRRMRDFLPGYMTPRHVQFVDDLPRTSNGKPDTESLRSTARELASLATQRVAADVNSEDLTSRITSFIRERIDPDFSPDHRRLAEVVDSVSFLELILALDSEFRLGIDLGGFSAASMESPATLAHAMLANAHRTPSRS